MATPGISSLPEPPDGDRNKGAGIIIVGTIFGSLGLVLVSIRLWVRARIIKRLGSDDLFIFLGLITIIAVLVMQGLEVKYGVGRHQYYLNLNPHLLEQESNAIAWAYISETIFVVSVMFTRISICLFLLRIFGTKKVWRWGLYSIIAFVIITGLPAGIMVLLQCHPTRRMWQPSQPGTCSRPEVGLGVGDFNGAASVLCDWTLATLPIAFMWNIQMSIRIKVGICVLMSMGFFSGICAVVRTVMLKGEKTQDVSWNLVNLMVWGGLEGTIGIIAACIPTIKPLFNPTIRHSRSSSKAWGRKLTPDGGNSQYEAEDNHRLHNASISLSILPPLPSSLDSPPGVSDRNYVEICGGRRVQGPEERSLVGTIPETRTRGEDGIRKEMTFSLDSFHAGAGKAWFERARTADEQMAFDSV